MTRTRCVTPAGVPTPGEWRLESDTIQLEVLCEAGYAVAIGCGDPNASYTDRNNEAEANARAIAALPAMVKALRDVANDVRAMPNGENVVLCGHCLCEATAHNPDCLVGKALAMLDG